MSVKRKISPRKIIQSILTLVLVCAGFMAIVSATKVQDKRTLTDISIQINNDKYGFVAKEDVEDILLHDRSLEEFDLASLDVAMMERILSGNPWIENAKVYVDNNRVLNAEVTQKVPVLRVFEEGGNSYYLDKNANPMPLSSQYNYYTLVVTNAPELRMDTVGISVRKQIMKVADFIRHDSFWTAQVAHFIVNEDMSFEIVPVLGNQRIILGDTSNLSMKFDHLFTFYKNVLSKVGWDKYDLLDLSYDGQLVASPALDWDLPKDKVINRINWVESIMGEYGKKVLEHNRMVTKQPVIQAKVDDAKSELKIPQENIQPASHATVDAGIIDTKQNKVKTKDINTTNNEKEKQTPKYIYNGSDD